MRTPESVFSPERADSEAEWGWAAHRWEGSEEELHFCNSNLCPSLAFCFSSGIQAGVRAAAFPAVRAHRWVYVSLLLPHSWNNSATLQLVVFACQATRASPWFVITCVSALPRVHSSGSTGGSPRIDGRAITQCDGRASGLGRSKDSTSHLWSVLIK